MVFNNQQRSGYEELKSYYPIFYENVLEMDAILQICGRMLDGMAKSMEQAVLNRFVETMDEEATMRIERFLYLSSNKNRPIEERKRVIMAILVGSGKISGTIIKNMIKVFNDAPIDVDFKNGHITIKINMAEVSVLYTSDINAILRKRIPAHLAFTLQGYFIVQILYAVHIRMDLKIQSEYHVRSGCQMLYLNGGCQLDGTYYLDGNQSIALYQVHPANLLVGSEVNTDIKCDNQLTVEKSLFYLDGSCCLDGEKTLDAEVIVYEDL